MVARGAASRLLWGTPPLFLWGTVILSPAVMGLAGQGAPGVPALGLLGLCLALALFELSPRQGRVLSVLVALLYVMMAVLLAGPPLSHLAAAQGAAALLSGALIAALIGAVARRAQLPAVVTLIMAALYAALIEGLAGAGAGGRDATGILAKSLAAGGLVAVLHAHLIRIARGPSRAADARFWMGEILSLAVAGGLVLLLIAFAQNSDQALLGLALSALLAGAALQRAIGPRVVVVLLLLFLSAYADPIAGLDAATTGLFLGLSLLALLPMRPLARGRVATRDEPAWLGELQPAAEAWLVTFDLGREEVILGPAAEAHFGVQRGVGGWLSQLGAEQSGRLLALLHGVEGAPLTISLRAADGREAAPYAVHLLDRQGAQSRVLLRRMASEEALKSAAVAMQTELDRMRLREERLLALASHELRTPIATLSMLAEEIDEGEPWEEIGPIFRTAIGQVLSVLDDLRARGKTEGELARAQELSPAQVVVWLREEFGPLCEALDLRFELVMPEADERRYYCETGRLLMVLEKLVRHALGLPDLLELRLTLVVMPLGKDRFTFVWSLMPRAEAALALPGPDLFEPFASGPEAGLGAKLHGAGLYAAEKAAIGMGGSLLVQPDPSGFIFVFTHPVRHVIQAEGAYYERDG